MKEITQIIGTIVLGILTIVVFSLLLAVPVMWLWNFVVPFIFGLTKITVWHALALMILCSLLFKSSNSSSK